MGKDWLQKYSLKFEKIVDELRENRFLKDGTKEAFGKIRRITKVSEFEKR
jgi:hypothetical protein